ncbi:MAG: DUF4920 domain-containing protein [Chitinophagales bacterium]|nr:DUF4920 domain-containing protein [Chitinophagales bacterium]MDW8274273.1 DUF4920 domain-containing protein [Chitinophagales bacterium]
MNVYLFACCLVAVFLHADAMVPKQKKKNKTQYFGEKITKDNAIDAKELPALMEGKEKENFKIKGKISEVCQVKGCWLTVDMGNGKSMRMTFKDYGFFVPKDAGGKTFYAEGEARYKTISVEMLRHYAEDAGKSKEEIEAIKEPKRELVFVAKGVIIE